MRALRLSLVAALLAVSLSAQVVPPQQSASLDVAALIDDRTRVALEPLVFGRWTLGLVGSFTRTGTTQDYYQQVARLDYWRLGGPEVALPDFCLACVGCCGPYYADQPKYRAWSLDLAARHYPAALSFSNPRHKMMVYIGEFVGYHQRRIEQSVYILPLGRETGRETDTEPFPPDSIVIYPPPIPTRFVQRLTGFEPGAEIGVRLMPLPSLFLDVGGWFRFVTIDDPMQRLRPGDVDSRLVVAFGVGW